MKNKLNTLISKLGEKFGFDAHYFVKNTFWLLFGQGIMSFSAFIATIFLANFVTKHDVGDYRFIISIYITLSALPMSGLGPSFMRAIVNKRDGALSDALSIKKRYGFYTFLVGLLISLYFLYKNNPIIAGAVFIASLSLVFIETYSLYSPYLQAKQEFKFSSINAGITKLVSSIAVVIIALIFPQTVYLVLAFYGSQAITNYIQYKSLVKRFPPENNDKDPEMLPYAKHLTLAGVGLFLFGQSDKFLLYHFFGPVTLASYWIASAIPQEVGRVVSTVGQVAFPKFVKVNHEDAKKSLSKKLVVSTLVLLGISTVYAFLAYPFFYLFFPTYISEVAKSIVLMFAFAVIPHYFVWSYYAAKARHKIMYFSNNIEPVLQIIFYFAFIPFFGIWGLVFAMLLKAMCMNAIAWYVISKY